MPLDRDLILGSWRMKSWVTTDIATRERRDALGENVRGFALYTPERVMFLILKNNRKPPDAHRRRTKRRSRCTTRCSPIRAATRLNQIGSSIMST